MPIHKSNTGHKLYYAVMNDDGSYSELIPLEGKLHVVIADNGDVLEIRSEEI